MNYNLLITTLDRRPAMACLTIANPKNPIQIDFHFKADFNLDIELIHVYFDGYNFKVTTGRGEELSIDNDVTQQLLSHALIFINDLEIRNLTDTEISKIRESALDEFTKYSMADFVGDIHEYEINFGRKDYVVLMIKNSDDVWEASTVSRTVVIPKE
ncbi:hypothetical protein [Pedobacter gandavensis]|uniref:hypothetical protein n=1 Tax=Pedobacter gandavensis TaxID=2679963 RepID=UPI00292E00F7|nr:hypothetical protein [Pedobacter gandavensis]